MSTESRTMRCDYPGCTATILIAAGEVSWRHDYGWAESDYGDCCREHRTAAKRDTDLLTRVRELVADLSVWDREKLVAILKVFGERP